LLKALAFVFPEGLGLRRTYDRRAVSGCGSCPPRPQGRNAGIQLYEEEGWEVRVSRRLCPQPGRLSKSPPA